MFTGRFLLLMQLLLFPSAIMAGDWPQILGVHRDANAVDEKIVDRIPDSGLAEVWQAKVGSGFAGPVVSGDTLILFHRIGAEDLLTAYDAATGTKRWSVGFKTSFEPQIVPDDGPRATPTIHQGRVYALASSGGLYCVDLKSGQTVWERQTHKDYHAPEGYFGAGSSPLVEAKLLIVNVGGDRDGAGIVAFHLADGKTAWQATRKQASYSSPIAVTVDGVRHLLCITRLNLVSLDPANGKERFRTPFGKRGPTVNAAVPVLIKNQALLTASYEIGAELLTLHADRVDVTWSDEVLSSQYTTPIVKETAAFGVDGRQDGGPVTLKCFDVQTRKTYWSKGIPYATLIAADGKLLAMQTNGTLSMFALDKSAARELGSASLLTGTTRALPALAGGLYYVRNESTLKCVSLKR